MTEKRYDNDNPRFRDEFGCVNDLLTGESYLCGNSAMVGERDAIDTAIVLCDLLNSLYDKNEQLKQTITEAYQNERTEIGKSVLKQLMEQIQ